jgi:hypothetical protein
MFPKYHACKGVGFYEPLLNRTKPERDMKLTDNGIWEIVSRLTPLPETNRSIIFLSIHRLLFFLVTMHPLQNKIGAS